jgi:protein-tyrosine phosphatase
MRSNLYWVEAGTAGRLATMARPRAGDWLEDEMKNLKAEGIDVVVSLLTRPEVIELGLECEAEACAAAGLQFRSLPIPDREVPPLDANTRAFLNALHFDLRDGRSVAIHCRMGIGRASLVAASVLRIGGVRGDEALTRIAAARGLPVPDTDQQRHWVTEFVP